MVIYIVINIEKFQTFVRTCIRLDVGCDQTLITTNFSFDFDIQRDSVFYYNGYCWKVADIATRASLSITNVPVYQTCDICNSINNVQPEPTPTPTPIPQSQSESRSVNYHQVKLRNCQWDETVDPSYKFYPLGSDEETIFRLDVQGRSFNGLREEMWTENGEVRWSYYTDSGIT